MEEERSTTMNRTPSWLSTEDDRLAVEIHHVWKPRPMGRSILWTPIGPARRNEPTGSYEVFVEQQTLETMYRHVWGANPDEEPFGYLFGDLCEDRESRSRYVIITLAIASAYPLLENESDQIADEATRALRREVRSTDRVLAGWYHRHREGPARLSAEDAATHLAHFAEPWQVAFLFVTDPDEPAGGCFQPRTSGITARASLPFHELAGAASLLAKGVCRTRIDWENVETRTEVLVEALPRPEVPLEAPEPVFEDDESGTESVNDVIDAGASEPEPVTAVAPIEEEKPIQPAPVTDAAPIEEIPFDEELVATAPVATKIRILYELSGLESMTAGDPDMESPRQTARAQPVSDPGLVVEHEVTCSADSQVESDASAEFSRKEAEKEASRQAAELEAARQQAQAKAEKQAAELKVTLEAAEASRHAAEAEASRRTAELEAARQQAEKEAERQAAEFEAARLAVEEEARRHTEELNATLAAAQQARQAAEEEATHRTAELEAARQQAEEDAERQAAELEVTLEAAEAARRAAEEEAAHRSAELKAARQQAEQDAERQAAELEAARREAQAEAEKQAAKFEAARLAVEEEARRHTEELNETLATAQQARQAAEEEATHRTAELEAARQQAEEDAERQAAELEAARRQAEEDAARRTAELEAARKAAEEESERQAAELQATLDAAEAARQAAAEAAARQAADAQSARKAAEQEAELPRTEEAARVEAEEAEISPASPGAGADRARRWRLDTAVDSVLVAAAVASIVVGALPLRYGNPTTIDQPGLTAALAGFVMPARTPVPTLEPAEERDPLALLGRDLRATIGRYRTIADMFTRRRLACAPLREAYVEVDEGWTAYSAALARNRDGLTEGLALLDESVYREVQEAEADFTASGCDRP